MTLTYDEFKKLDAKFLDQILLGVGVYTCILGLITVTVFTTNLPESSISESCDNFQEVYLDSSDKDEIVFSFMDSGNATSTYLCTEVEREKAPLWISLVSVLIFVIYLAYNAQNIKDGQLLAKLFKSRGEDQLAHYFNKMQLWKFLQMVCVEACGFVLLFRSTNATDVLVNSSATLFLGEVDEVFVALLLAHYKNSAKLIRTIEFGGLEIEFDPAEISEKETNKDLLPEGGVAENSK